MSQFQGGNKVRCIDCTKLSGKTCTAKNTSVSVKKRRSCSQYQFSGEYVNSTPLPATYMPHVDNKTKQLLKKLAKMGVMPMTGTRPEPTIKSDIYEQVNVEVNTAAFGTTATSKNPTVQPLRSHGETEAIEGEVWSTEDEKSGNK